LAAGRQWQAAGRVTSAVASVGKLFGEKKRAEAGIRTARLTDRVPEVRKAQRIVEDAVFDQSRASGWVVGVRCF
jgi:hypothetical protein